MSPPALARAVVDDGVQRVAGRFRLRIPFAAGASGTSWIAEDESPTTAPASTAAAPDHPVPVLLKVLTTRFAAWTRGGHAKLAALAAERRAMVAGLPGLRELIDDPADGVALVFGPVGGTPLDQVLLGHPEGVAVDAARRAVARIADAVAALHAIGIAHLDLRPATVATDHAFEQVALVDWGHAVALGTTTGGMPGFAPASVPYTSPALLVGSAPAIADDVFALGCIAHELFTGLHPFGRRPATEQGIAAPVPIAALDPHEQAVLAKALAIDPAARQVSAAEIAAIFGGRAGRRTQSSGSERVVGPGTGGYGGLVWLAILFAACAVAAFWFTGVRPGIR